MMMSGMSSAIFVYCLVISAIPPATGFLAVVFLVVGAVNPCVMSLAILVGCLVVCTVVLAAGFPAMVFLVVGAVDACMAVSVMANLMMPVGVCGAAGGRNQQSGSEQ